ncbi:hypothetical protein [Aurantiacibacter hainanensis]|uniref:hypothetical protein n=1 Tax=Aurantiacibacter hainanensis TaxID=3076114 RepID=UPI0030C6A995
MKINTPVFRIALGGACLAVLLTALRYFIGGWYDDLPNTLAGFGSAALVGAALGTYVALMTKKYGKMRALTQRP